MSGIPRPRTQAAPAGDVGCPPPSAPTPGAGVESHSVSESLWVPGSKGSSSTDQLASRAHVCEPRVVLEDRTCDHCGMPSFLVGNVVLPLTPAGSGHKGSESPFQKEPTLNAVASFLPWPSLTKCQQGVGGTKGLHNPTLVT